MIVVTGATGFIGRHLVGQLLQAGYPVRVLLPRNVIARYTRRQSQWPWHEYGTAEIAEGSIFQGEALFQAVQGAHTVFHLASAQWWGSINDLEKIDLVGTRQVIAAARSARVGRIIFLSQPGASPASAHPLLRIKGRAENLIRASGIAYTIFRCGIVFGPEDRFINNLAMILQTNPFVFLQPGEGENLLNPIYIDDLMKALIISMESLALVDELVEIGGNEYISLNELIRTIMRVTRTRRLIFPIPPYVLRWITGLMNTLLPRWLMTRQWFDILAGNRTAAQGNLYKYTGVQPVRFEDQLLTYMPQRRYALEMPRFLFKRRPGINF